jgi:hypothetical protein
MVYEHTVKIYTADQPTHVTSGAESRITRVRAKECQDKSRGPFAIPRR